MGELHDLLRDLAPRSRTGGRPKGHLCKRLHDRILWEEWCRLEGGEEALGGRYVLRTGSQDGSLMMRSDEFQAYRTGLRSMSQRRLDAITSQHPGFAELVRWPLGVFDTRSLPTRVLLEWHDQYILDPHPFWGRYKFPGDAEKEACGFRPLTLHDQEGLYERGDIYGFLTLACIYRLHHANRLADRQWYSARYLVRALPGACRDPRVRPHAEALISLAKQLLILLPDTSFPIRVDDLQLWEQINAPVYEPCYQARRIAESQGVGLPEPVPPWIPYTYKVCSWDQQPMLYAQGK